MWKSNKIDDTEAPHEMDDVEVGRVPSNSPAVEKNTPAVIVPSDEEAEEEDGIQRVLSHSDLLCCGRRNKEEPPAAGLDEDQPDTLDHVFNTAESALCVSQPDDGNTQPHEPDALDDVFNATERTCCSRGTKQVLEAEEEKTTPLLLTSTTLDDDENESVLLTAESNGDESGAFWGRKRLQHQRSGTSEAFEMKAEYDDEVPPPALKKKLMPVRALSSIAAPLGLGRWLSMSRACTAPVVELHSTPVENNGDVLPDDEPAETASNASTAVVENTKWSPVPDTDPDQEPSELGRAGRATGFSKLFSRGKGTIDQVEESALDPPSDHNEPPSKKRGGFGSFFFGSGTSRDEKAAAEAAALDRNAVEVEAHFEGDERTIMSDNAQNTTMEEPEMVGTFLDENEEAQWNEDQEKGIPPATTRSRSTYALIFLLLIIIGILSGFLANKAKESRDALRSFFSGSQTGKTTSPTFRATSAPIDNSGSTDDTATSVQNTTDTDEPSDDVVGTEEPSDSNTATEEPTTDCFDSISVDSLCYRFGRDEITVSFSFCNETSQDWVGLYPSDAGMDNLPNPDDTHWEYTCGGQNCDEPIPSGAISMSADVPAGTYRAYLFSNVDGDFGAPYFSVAASEAFVITTGSC